MKKLIKTNNQLILDHIFILVRKGAPEAEVLKELGFYYPGIINNHTGLGTAGTYFFFDNFYLELLWIEDEVLYRSTIDQLYNSNMKGSGFLPRFGIAFSLSGTQTKLPFETKKLRWDWMHHGTYLTMSMLENENEPLYFTVPDYMAYKNRLGSESIKPLKNHKFVTNSLTKINFHYSDENNLSAAGKFLSDSMIISFEKGDTNCIELIFDGGKCSRSYDLQNILPLVIIK